MMNSFALMFSLLDDLEVVVNTQFTPAVGKFFMKRIRKKIKREATKSQLVDFCESQTVPYFGLGNQTQEACFNYTMLPISEDSYGIILSSYLQLPCKLGTLIVFFFYRPVKYEVLKQHESKCLVIVISSKQQLKHIF